MKSQSSGERGCCSLTLATSGSDSIWAATGQVGKDSLAHTGYGVEASLLLAGTNVPSLGQP